MFKPPWKVWPEYDREIVEGGGEDNRTPYVLYTFRLPEDSPEAVPTCIGFPFKVKNGESAAFDEMLAGAVADLRRASTG